MRPVPSAWAVLLALALPLLALPAGALDRLAVEDVRWGDDATRGEVSPGESGRVLTVLFRNAVNEAVTQIDVDLDLPPGVSPAYAGADEAHSGLLAAGSAWEAEFSLDLSPDLDVGDSLRIPMTVETTTVDATGDLGPRKEESSVLEVPITGRTRLAIAAGESTLPAGSVADVPLLVRNEGDGDAETVEVALAPAAGSGVQVERPVSSVVLGRIPAGGAASFDARLLTPEANGLHGLVATIEYVNAAGGRTEVEQNVPLLVLDDPLGQFEARLAEERLAAGRTQTLTFTVTNDGPLARGVVAELDVPAAAAIVPVNASDVAALGDLAPGAGATFRVPVAVAETGVGTHALTLSLTWRDEAGLGHRRAYTFGVLVEGLVDLRVQDLCASYEPDAGRVAVSGLLTNLGNTPANNADARIVGDGVRPSAREELGDVDPDDSFTFEVDTTAERAPETVRVVLSWTMEGGRNGTMPIDVPVSGTTPCFEPPGSREENGTPAAPFALAVAALAAVALALSRRR